MMSGACACVRVCMALLMADYIDENYHHFRGFYLNLFSMSIKFSGQHIPNKETKRITGSGGRLRLTKGNKKYASRPCQQEESAISRRSIT